jgi:hypothetical protein
MAIAFFSPELFFVFFSKPPTILSRQRQESCLSAAVLSYLAAINAASRYERLQCRAQRKPGVCLAKIQLSSPSTFFSMVQDVL